MITTTTSGNLGWNPFHALKTVVRNPLVQNVAKAEANQYAPGTYSQVASGVNQAKAIYRAGQGPQPAGPTGPHGQMAPDDGSGGGGGGGPAGPPAQNSHILIYGLVGAGILVALLALNK
ncbi:MAG TPA: hypothetical protein VGY48_15170 [Vicinamibacterales bacterium]|nr:hypothetical protein [Vicinamibacterales bacterium]